MAHEKLRSARLAMVDYVEEFDREINAQNMSYTVSDIVDKINAELKTLWRSFDLIEIYDKKIDEELGK